MNTLIGYITFSTKMLGIMNCSIITLSVLVLSKELMKQNDTFF
jgi:hypothetical protein